MAPGESRTVLPSFELSTSALPAGAPAGWVLFTQAQVTGVTTAGEYFSARADVATRVGN
jgi:hypothetical protein